MKIFAFAKAVLLKIIMLLMMQFKEPIAYLLLSSSTFDVF
jgi:hypothetical protein